MCGSAGIISRQKRELGHLLEAMLKRIEHRGPDGAGVVIGNECQKAEGIKGLESNRPFALIALGHVRLAITGDMTEAQPLESSDGSLRLVQNGEIYNYRELAKAHRLDVDLDTISDSVVVLRLLEQHYVGDLVAAMESILPQLDGVYALAVGDGETTVLARDRIGVRQLYYNEHNALFAFASEKKALSVLSQDTAGIRSLKPGQMLVVTPHRHHNVPFPDPEVIRAAFAIAAELKIPQGNGSFDKQIHRDYCLSLGIPREIAFRKEQAAQHGANVHSALEVLSRAQNVTEDALAATGYTPAHNGGQVPGSSSHSGYRYASERLWRPKALVQYCLDSITAEYGQMSRAWRFR